MGPVFVSLPMDDMQAELGDTQAAEIAAVRDRKVLQAVGFPADLAAAWLANRAAIRPINRPPAPRELAVVLAQSRCWC